MKSLSLVLTAVVLLALALASSFAADQTIPGAGNDNAVALAKKSPIVQSAYRFLGEQAWKINNDKLRLETIDGISNPDTCVEHRAGLTDDQKTDPFRNPSANALEDRCRKIDRSFRPSSGAYSDCD